MAKTDNLTDFLTDIADAIREKKGTTGAINPQDFSSEIASIEGGGGGGGAVTSASVSDVNFYDYDGTILHSYTKEQFLALSAMPGLPTRDGLICQGWNWTIDDAKEYVTDYGMLNIGTMYITDDGDTRLYIRIATEGRMTVPLYWSQTKASGVSIDWGDGSVIESFSSTGNMNTTHTYANPGDYVIRLKVTRGTLEFGNGSSSYCVMGYSGFNGQVYCNMLQKVEIGYSVTRINNYTFNNCTSLASVSIPSSVTSIGITVFSGCRSLASISIPSSVPKIDERGMSGCSSLASVCIPNSVTSIGNNAFNSCYSLASVSIPSSVTSIVASGFSSCYSLAVVSIPSSVTNISTSVFSGCYGMAIYDFTKHTSVPTLSNTNAFSSIPSDCVIKVPASLAEEWKAATNWSTYADKIVGV